MLKLIPKPLRHYARFYGRMTRSQYFRWLGIIVVIIIICAWVDLRYIAPALGYLPFEEVEEQYLTSIAAVLLMVPWISSTGRRLHDVDRSGWWMILAIGPLIIYYFSEEIGIAFFEYLSTGVVSDEVLAFALDWLPWLTIVLSLISFSPVIYWCIKKGSSDENRFGERE